MSEKPTQTSSQSATSAADLELKPDHGIDTNSVQSPTADLSSGHQTAATAGPSTSSTASRRPSSSSSAHPAMSRMGCHASPQMAAAEKIVITVAPFTGGPFSLSVNKTDTVEDLKKIVAKKLKVLKERICLLYRESQLSDGSLEQNHLVNGSRITLLPRAETGLLAQRPEQSVMQALESLNDNQVVDFLSGKAPLNLTMRLGDHMMLIQLQLSTVNSAAGSKRPRTSASQASTGPTPTATSASATTSRPEVSSSRTSSHPSSAESSGSSSYSTPATSPTSSTSSTDSEGSSSNAIYRPKLDTRALTEASKNLTQTLKQLSSEVLTTRTDEDRPRKRPRPGSAGGSFGGAGGGAIIESMHHHGKGVYSGTFSGTLNPALQDRNGQPKRDITTIIHILNDLLCAQYKNYSTSRSSTKAPAASSTATSSGSAAKSAASHSSGPAKSSGNGANTFSRHLPGFEAASMMANGERLPADADEQTVTRCKMEHLRRIMEERKARRRMRREAAAARAAQYSTSWSVKSSEATTTATMVAAPNGDGSSSNGDGLSSSAASATASNASGPGSAASATAAGSAASDIFNPELETVTA